MPRFGTKEFVSNRGILFPVPGAHRIPGHGIRKDSSNSLDDLPANVPQPTWWWHSRDITGFNDLDELTDWNDKISDVRFHQPNANFPPQYRSSHARLGGQPAVYFEGDVINPTNPGVLEQDTAGEIVVPSSSGAGATFAVIGDFHNDGSFMGDQDSGTTATTKFFIDHDRARIVINTAQITDFMTGNWDLSSPPNPTAHMMTFAQRVSPDDDAWDAWFNGTRTDTNRTTLAGDAQIYALGRQFFTALGGFAEWYAVDFLFWDGVVLNDSQVSSLYDWGNVLYGI